MWGVVGVRNLVSSSQTFLRLQCRHLAMPRHPLTPPPSNPAPHPLPPPPPPPQTHTPHLNPSTLGGLFVYKRLNVLLADSPFNPSPQRITGITKQLAPVSVNGFCNWPPSMRLHNVCTHAYDHRALHVSGCEC